MTLKLLYSTLYAQQIRYNRLFNIIQNLFVFFSCDANHLNIRGNLGSHINPMLINLLTKVKRHDLQLPSCVPWSVELRSCVRLILLFLLNFKKIVINKKKIFI